MVAGKTIVRAAVRALLLNQPIQPLREDQTGSERVGRAQRVVQSGMPILHKRQRDPRGQVDDRTCVGSEFGDVLIDAIGARRRYSHETTEAQAADEQSSERTQRGNRAHVFSLSCHVPEPLSRSQRSVFSPYHSGGWMSSSTNWMVRTPLKTLNCGR